jgi:hypothetical protein
MASHDQRLLRQLRQAREAYYIRRRDLYISKRDLPYTQKRPTMLEKETYYTRKRDLLY